MDDEKDSYDLKEYIEEIKKNGLFSKKKLSIGEGLIIFFTIMLIVVMLYAYFNSGCEINCSLCTDCTSKIVQSKSIF